MGALQGTALDKRVSVNIIDGSWAAMLEQYFVFLFVKLAVSASLASILARPAFIQRIFLDEERTLEQRLKLAIAFSLVFGTSVATRVLSRDSYKAVDIGLEGAILTGLVGG